MEYSVILFHSTNHAIWASNLLKKSGLSHAMVPVPRHISSDCGYCVRINSDDGDKIEPLLKSAGIEYQDIQKL
jgi:hypothetical protein